MCWCCVWHYGMLHPMCWCCVWQYGMLHAMCWAHWYPLCYIPCTCTPCHEHISGTFVFILCTWTLLTHVKGTLVHIICTCTLMYVYSFFICHTIVHTHTHTHAGNSRYASDTCIRNLSLIYFGHTITPPTHCVTRDQAERTAPPLCCNIPFSSPALPDSTRKTQTHTFRTSWRAARHPCSGRSER